MNRTVTDIMQPCRYVAVVEETVAEVAIKMLDCNKRWLPVVDADDRPLGVIHADDLASVQGPDIRQGVRRCAVTVGPEVSFLELVRLMLRDRSEYALVLSEGKLAGEVLWVNVKKIMTSS